MITQLGLEVFEKDSSKQSLYLEETPETNFAGTWLNSSRLTPNNTFELSFKLTKHTGTIVAIGGHLDFSTKTEVYINNKKTVGNLVGIKNHWLQGILLENPMADGETIDVKILFNTNEYDLDVYDFNPIKIQPNRQYNLTDLADKKGFTHRYTATISDLTIVGVEEN